jgi:MFS transporter, DHA1 family, multidrug resistance protein
MRDSVKSDRPIPLSSTLHHPLGFVEFVALISATMALIALSIDFMLPALPDIGRALHVANPNERQWVIGAFMLGVTVGTLFFGALSDHYGRRRVLLFAITLFLLGCVICAVSNSFMLLLFARMATGFFAAACRIVSVSIVRDCFHGDDMARVISLSMLIFMVVPLLAPSLGQLVLYVASWRWTFGALAMLCAIMLLWIWFRLPETLAPENRVAIGWKETGAMFMEIISNRTAMSYALASGLMMGGQTGFIVSVQQIVFDVFDAANVFPLAFASMTIWMAIGSLFNSQLVRKIGARRLSQSALLISIGLSAIHVVLATMGYESFASFIAFQGAMMICLSFAGANFGSVAMQPFTRGAGQAASVQGFLSGLISFSIGAFIGLMFDGTTLPLALGYLGSGIVALALVLYGEEGRLFRRLNPPT